MFDFLSEKFSSIFSTIENKKKLTADNIKNTIQDVENALLQADVPYNVVRSFSDEVQKEVIGQKIDTILNPAEHLLTIIQKKIITFLGNDCSQLSISYPCTIMVMGLQGSGKTTTIGKLAYKLKHDAQRENKSLKILVASVDFYRPAAIDQLEILAKKINVSFYRSLHTKPLQAAQDIYGHFKQNAYDVLLFDTAGRLHIDNTMLQELQDITIAIQPDRKILVLDAMTGQESLAVAQAFDSIVGFNGAILTKMDSDTRGGSTFAFRYTLKKPIFFVGEGENMTDLRLFFPDRAAERILGLGDMQSLLDRAQEKLSREEHARMEKEVDPENFSLQDFADQLAMMNKLGSLQSLLQYMPGLGAKKPSTEMLHQGQIELNKFKAIIGSMTKEERSNPKQLNPSRIMRIARGAGVKTEDIALMLNRFEEIKGFMKNFSSVYRK